MPEIMVNDGGDLHTAYSPLVEDEIEYRGLRWTRQGDYTYSPRSGGEFGARVLPFYVRADASSIPE